ncbi:MAG: MurR/RpiR family transcriptional regulator [Treponema sp.]|nr:MurR/RpiR family transcriptional regulator [Treponema sp.]
MMLVLEDEIRKARLTKTSKQIADFVLENVSRICFMTTDEISREMGVSDASIIRFAQSLGYSGFADLQKRMQTSLSDHLEHSTGDSQLPPFERINRIVPYLADDNLVQSMMEVMTRNFEDTFKYNDMKKVEKISKCLISSRRKFIVGTRGGQDLAFLYANLLSQALPNVFPVSHADASYFEPLLEINNKDCAIIISLPRYSDSVRKITSFINKSGAKKIVITNKATAPPAKSADILFTVGVDNVTFSNSRITSVFLAELILADVTRKIDFAELSARLQKHENLNPLNYTEH